MSLDHYHILMNVAGRTDLIRCAKFEKTGPQTVFSCLEGHGGQDWIRTSEGVCQRIYSPPRLATSVPTHESAGGFVLLERVLAPRNRLLHGDCTMNSNTGPAAVLVRKEVLHAAALIT